ncbi:MAG: hypothetical protein A2Y17_00350 [Clostridiales bacterium GWF2_38_85]|nr:MAG: hypothetical protein A2Y17_00350 [Clostridiales bacterium GWF2_38_85]HBL83911.1 oxidoreductase [Clostridiales bacterium]
MIKKIRFATIGTSWICEEFIETAKTFPEFELKAIYSRNEQNAITFAQKHKSEKYYIDLEKMASDNEIDAVYIASPNSFHAEQSILFMQKGKSVLCEKPLGSNVFEVKKMIECAEENDVLLMEAYKSMLMPGLLTVYENLHKLGQIRSVYANFSKYSTRYDRHKNGDNVNTFKAEYSNGAMLDLGIYCLNPVIFMFGMPEQVKAIGQVIPDGVDGANAVIMKYDGLIVTLNFSKISNSFLPCEIQGEDATMIIDRFNIPEKVDIIYRDKRTETLEFSQRHDSMCYEIEEFINCLTTGGKPKINSLRLSLNSIEIADEIRRQIGVIYPADNTILN